MTALGLDTTFLVQVEVREHPTHGAARALLDQLLQSGDRLAIAPQVLTEFIHIVSDPRRFSAPLSVDEATARAGFWWTAREVTHALPSDASVRLFLRWLDEHGLGRKRLLGTLLAATYVANGVDTIVSTNARDFSVFDELRVVTP